MFNKLIVCCVAFAVCLRVQASPLAVPPLSGRVVDGADVLSAAEEQRLEAAVSALESATGGQMAVLTVPTLGAEESLEAYSMRVAESWRIGHKGRDDGAVLVVVTQDRLMRLEIGYGWEGSVNDARSGDIIRGMTTFFRQNRFADGMVYAVQQVQTYVTGSEPPEALHVAAQASAGTPWPVFIFVAIIVLLIVFKGRRSSRLYWGGGGGFSGGDGGGFSSGGGGFSGGGGGFGGGGSSGRW